MPTERRLTLHGRRWPLLAGLMVLGVLLLAGALPAPGTPPAYAADGPRDGSAPSPEPGRPWFGPGLDWTRDLPADYAERLGETPSLYAQRVHYPLTADDRGYLDDVARQAATQGAVVVLSLEPQVALASLTPRDAEVLAEVLADLHHHYDTHVLVRFAPEMNGSWVTWGQQPERYVTAFRTVADALHGATAHAETVWSPAYGAGYPFGRAYGAVDPAGARLTEVLDTNGDGAVDDGDDPYSPYFPGDRWVDWVGLSLYRYGAPQEFGDNTAPAPGELEARLDERFGYGVARPREPFLERFASRDRPMLVETSALWNTAYDGGDSQRDLERSWWRQVLDATATHPAIGAISWLELTRPEAEIDGEVADWRATHRPGLARALRADLAASDVVLGPVTEVVKFSTGAGSAPGSSAVTGGDDDSAAEAAGTSGSSAGWAPAAVAVLAGGYALFRLLTRRRSSRA